jgi:nicotinate-nucleotide pyrophosphorylase (carboxylating)
MFLPKRVLSEKILKFLEEDVGQGDITTQITIPNNIFVEAEIIVKEAGLIAGVEEALVFCEALNLQVTDSIPNGMLVKPKTSIMHLKGNARALLSIERTLLNLLSRMSGIATTTHSLITKLRKASFQTRIASTRKTAPGLSYFDKKAVRIGGGDTHRLHLDDLVLIKDNHLEIIGSVTEAIKTARKAASFTKKIEIEVTSVEKALEAAKAGADIILLDNFHVSKIKEAISILSREGVRNKVLLESSGRITEENILEYASTGVDIISLGEITHSTKTLDMSLEITKVIKR